MPVEQWIGLVVLVLAAMGAGWLLARWRNAPIARNGAPFPRADYFKGLNFLLNEQPDKAIEVFIRMVEVDSDTVETHFALASLFRRRGEVDRAIRLHQNLIARPNLSRTHRYQALRELGEDYMRAGLFDRAESLFLELVDVRPHMEAALRQLVAIYEQQKDWDQAIAMRRKLETATGENQNAIIAQYFCELAAAQADGDGRAALRLLKRAQSFDRDSVRAGIMLGELALRGGEPALAIRHFRRVLESEPVFASEVLPGMAAAFRAMNDAGGFDELVRTLVARSPTAAGEVALAAILRPEIATAETERCVGEYIRTSQSLAGLQEILTATTGEAAAQLEPAHVQPLENALRRLLSQGAGYRCDQCGYAGKTLYWQCPSCRGWGTTRPHHDFSLGPRAHAVSHLAPARV
jgi:lipopolysaccharide biosynthesis regulator YciM